MKSYVFILILCICALQDLYSQQEDGVVALTLPVRNSLTFNRFAMNPTFSFVREQSKYISINNKREWVQFDDAPLTYLASFSGRFAENIGAGIGLFQQDYGVLTTFGGLLNFAYNAQLTSDNNLTFGMNVAAYSSGINTGRVVTNFSDPSLQNVPENFLVTINPGINFGTTFFDFGVSANNLVSYNVQTSEILEDNPEMGIQGHIMYTGYMRSGGFFDDSKFSGLVRSEFKQDETIVSALAMIMVPKGIWAQVGYNSVFGVSGGIGLNITQEIAVEYNYERSIGDLTDFGPSHDITLAYRFKNRQRYDYSSGDEVASLISPKKRKPSKLKLSRETTEANRRAAQERKAELLAQREAEQQAKKETAAQAKLLAEQKAKEDAEAQAKLAAEQKAKEADAEAKRLAEQKAKEEADAEAKRLAEQKAKEEAVAQAKRLAEQKAKEEAEAQAKLLAEQKAKEEAEAQAKLLAEQKAKEEAEAQAKLAAEQKAKEEAEAQAKLLAEQKAKEEAEAKAKLLAEQKAKEEAETQAKLLAEQKAKEELITNPKDELGKTMYALAQDTEKDSTAQNDLLKKFNEIVEIKNQDLKDLKEENDLSEQGITVAPKPFKSITEENRRLAQIKSDLDDVIEDRNSKINELKELYEDNFLADTLYNDEVFLYYQKTLKRLESEQAQAIKARTDLDTRLEEIRIATEFEKRRRIKRAAFDNEEERYAQDRATLKTIKESTQISGQELSESDFDFGEAQSDNIQILKNVANIDNGYYVVLAVHNNVQKRDDFLRKVVASGESNIDFFYDVNTSKYYIYSKKFESIEQANQHIEAKGNKPFNKNMSLVKIEN